MKALEVLTTAAKIERKIADIYDLFRKAFSQEEETSSFWETLVSEEEAHAAFLDAESVMVRLKPDIFGGAILGAGILEESYREIEALEKRVEKGGTDHKEALSIAFMIETEVVEKKYNRLIETGDPYIKKIFCDLTKKNDHIEKIVLAADKSGVKIRQ
ncbi:MAG: hypothetical protein OEV42_12620 [Deltaproteobacteria bacterium]|nr:hypothetical protein [Deltaproteobacteria bacterium]